MYLLSIFFVFFFFNDTATTEIYTLSLHDALPISSGALCSCVARAPRRFERETNLNRARRALQGWPGRGREPAPDMGDRKSTRLNSSHLVISYAVFCLKKKKKKCYEHISVKPSERS